MDYRSISNTSQPPPGGGILDLLARPQILFGLAFAARILAIPLSVFRINPYAQADATGFSVVAGIIANNILSGTFSIATRYTEIYEIWGSVLAPFWFLPVGGPILARICLSALAAYAVYNAVMIARRVGSPMAGLLTGLPLVFYPSIVLIQSSLLREAAILFCVTTAARLLLRVSDRSPNTLLNGLSRWRAAGFVALSVGLLAFATVLRSENLPLYALAIAAGCVAYYSTTRWGQGAAAIMAGGGLVGAWVLRDWVIQRFSHYRDVRSRGRAVYLGDVRFETLLDLVAFAPVGAAYFLFAPFPWQIGSVLDIPVMIEGVANILYALAGIVGFGITFKRDRAVAVGLGTFFIFGIILYGFGTANYGTGVRHRQMFSWILFIFGGVGAHWLWLRYAPSRW